MSKRRLDINQPDGFEFSRENLAWAKKLIAKYPKGKQRSAVIPLLWRAQEQNEGWVSEAALRRVGDMLDMAYIRVYEVATFYTMFQLSPVGKKAHIQVCGTTPCMLRGAEDLIKICKRRISQTPHTLSDDGDFSWEEVECLGACVNAPMIQIFKDTYEDLDAASFELLLDGFEKGTPPKPGPQTQRQYSAPITGATTLAFDMQSTGQVTGDSMRLNPAEDSVVISGKDKTVSQNGEGTKAEIVRSSKKEVQKKKSRAKEVGAKLKNVLTGKGKTTKPSTVTKTTSSTINKNTGTPSRAKSKATAGNDIPQVTIDKSFKPEGIKKPSGGTADDLKRIRGIGPKIETTLNELGFYHFDQIAAWTKKNILWVDDHLAFRGRIQREDWIKQAKTLASGKETEFSKRVASGKVPSSK